jgi:hypothetical protein
MYNEGNTSKTVTALDITAAGGVIPQEGTWTPAFSGGITAGDTTYTTQVGSYEKIGRQVTIRGRITVNLLGTLDGNVSMTGLPFTSSADANSFGAVHFCYGGNLVITTGSNPSGYVNVGTATVTLRIWNVSTGTSKYDDLNLTDGADFMFSGTYYV